MIGGLLGLIPQRILAGLIAFANPVLVGLYLLWFIGAWALYSLVLSSTERRAYLEAVEEQGAMPEPANRQMRRAQGRMQAGSRPAGSGARKRKKR